VVTAHVVLHVGHRMGNAATVEGVAALAADVVPDFREQVARSVAMASLVQLDSLPDPDHDCVWLAHVPHFTITPTVAAMTTCDPQGVVVLHPDPLTGAAQWSVPIGHRGFDSGRPPHAGPHQLQYQRGEYQPVLA